jgi:hypothetical protein
MMLAQQVLRHWWIPSVLIATACGGGSFGGGMAKRPTSVADSGYYGPAPGGHIATEGGGQITPDRPGLGTSWGESVHAPISFSPFVRSNSRPWSEVVLHYNDSHGVQAHAQYLGTHPQPLEIYAGDGSIGIALVDDSGHTLPGYMAQGRALIVGEDNARYRIAVRNGTTARFEIVASVDGLDVIDGKPADPNRRGYIVDPQDTLIIDGFRTSDSNVAAFRFGRVADSYASKTSGDRNVGVIGFAIFAERGAHWNRVELQRRDTANPFPQRDYSVAPR